MLKLITDKNEIAQCQKTIEGNLKSTLKRSKILEIGYQGGKISNEVYFNDSIWYSTLLLKKNVGSMPY